MTQKINKKHVKSPSFSHWGRCYDVAPVSDKDQGLGRVGLLGFQVQRRWKSEIIAWEQYNGYVWRENRMTHYILYIYTCVCVYVCYAYIYISSSKNQHRTSRKASKVKLHRLVHTCISAWSIYCGKPIDKPLAWRFKGPKSWWLASTSRLTTPVYTNPQFWMVVKGRFKIKGSEFSNYQFSAKF